jgi:hypothetical protein
MVVALAITIGVLLMDPALFCERVAVDAGAPPVDVEVRLRYLASLYHWLRLVTHSGGQESAFQRVVVYCTGVWTQAEEQERSQTCSMSQSGLSDFGCGS